MFKGTNMGIARVYWYFVAATVALLGLRRVIEWTRKRNAYAPATPKPAVTLYHANMHEAYNLCNANRMPSLPAQTTSSHKHMTPQTLSAGKWPIRKYIGLMDDSPGTSTFRPWENACSSCHTGLCCSYFSGAIPSSPLHPQSTPINGRLSDFVQRGCRSLNCLSYTVFRVK